MIAIYKKLLVFTESTLKVENLMSLVKIRTKQWYENKPYPKVIYGTEANMAIYSNILRAFSTSGNLSGQQKQT